MATPGRTVSRWRWPTPLTWAQVSEALAGIDAAYHLLHSIGTGDLDEVRRAAEFHLNRGTTTLLASLVTRPPDELAESLTRLRDSVATGIIAGVHLEGPFLSRARCGAHDPGLLRAPRPHDVAELFDAGARVATDGSGGLAGSTITISVAVRNSIPGGVGVLQAVTAATATPARTLGLDRGGRVAAGLAADLVVLDEELAVKRVMKDGATCRHLSGVSSAR